MRLRLFTIVLSLPCGAALNIAVACTSALLGAPTRSQQYFFYDGSTRVDVLHSSGFGVDQYDSVYDFPDFFLPASANGCADVPRWARRRGLPGQHVIERVKAVGWPFRCLHCGAAQLTTPAPGAPPMSTWGCLKLWPRYGTLQGVLPLVPIWRGIVSGSLLHFLVLWLILSVALLFRHHMRARRGLCPKCAYPLGSSARCTECGNPLGRKYYNGLVAISEQLRQAMRTKARYIKRHGRV